MVVENFKEKNTIIDEDLMESIPNECPDCGYPLEISETLMGLHCSNPFCRAKVKNRLSHLLLKRGVNLSDYELNSFVENFNITTPFFIFTYNPDKDGAMCSNIDMDRSRIIANKFSNNNNTEHTLVDFISLAHIPFVEGSIGELFKDYDDIEDFYADMQEEGVDFVSNKLGFKTDNSLSLRSIRIYNSLITYKTELIDGFRKYNNGEI